MLLALSIIISIGGVLHTHLADIYLMSLPPSATPLSPGAYSSRLTVVWRADGVAIILSALGIWTIKMNFMLFFYRLGHKIKTYTISWWVAVVVIVACGGVLLGLLPYDCMFKDSAWVNTHCTTASKMGYIYSVYQANIALDILSDLISESATLSKPFFARVTNSKPQRSHCVPHFHLVEHQDLPVPEARSVGNLFPRRIHYSCNRCTRKYLLWCLQVR